MTQLNEIRVMNDTMILYLKKLGKDTRRNEIINKILEDESCFFKMNKDDAYVILNDVGIKNQNIDNIYSELISNDVFYDLYKKGKIDKNNDELVIKYKIYDRDNLFKNSTLVIPKEIERNELTGNALVEYKETFFLKMLKKIKRLFSKK